MEIKYLTSADVKKYWNTLLQLVSSCFVYPVTDEFCEGKLTGLCDYLDEKKAYLIGVVEDERLLAFYWAYELNDGPERRFHFAYGAVHPEYRGLGLFNLMDKEAERKAKELGISLMDLRTSSPTVAKIYENSQGYKVDCYIMSKRI